MNVWTNKKLNQKNKWMKQKDKQTNKYERITEHLNYETNKNERTT